MLLEIYCFISKGFIHTNLSNESKDTIMKDTLTVQKQDINPIIQYQYLR